MEKDIEKMTKVEAFDFLKSEILTELEKKEFCNVAKVTAMIEERERLSKSLNPLPLDKEAELRKEKQFAFDWLMAKKRGDFAEVEKLVKANEKYTGTSWNTTGTYIVPTLLVRDLIRSVTESYWHRQYFTILPVPGYPSGQVPVHGTGATAYRAAEVATVTESAPVPSRVQFSTYEMKARVYLTDKLMETAGIDLVPYYIELLGRASAALEHYEVAVGTGSSMWKGFEAETFTQTVDGSDFSPSTLVKAYLTIKPADRTNAVWVGGDTAIANLLSMRDKTDRLFFDFTTDPPRVFGKPVLSNSNFTRSSIWFGNAKSYYIFDQRNYRIDVSNAGDALRSYGMTGLYSTSDNDGKHTRLAAWVEITSVPTIV